MTDTNSTNLEALLKSIDGANDQATFSLEPTLIAGDVFVPVITEDENGELASTFIPYSEFEEQIEFDDTLSVGADD